MYNFKRDPYRSTLAGAYVTAINILAVEYLIKTQDEETYGKYCELVNELSDDELDDLQFDLSFNMHTSSLGAMITQGDYDEQRKILMDYLDGKMED